MARMRWSALATACLMFAHGHLAVGQPPTQLSPPADVPPALVKRGQVELAHSRVYMHVGKTGLGYEHAVVGKLASGELHLSAAEKPEQNPGKLVFDLRTFEADTDAARKYIGLGNDPDQHQRSQVTEAMLGPDVLDVDKYPLATFIITRVTKVETVSPRGLPQYEVAGDFRLHGTTRPIQFTVDVEVVKVRTSKVRAKPKRRGPHSGKSRSWKKAIVELAPGETIELFEGAAVEG